MDGVKDDGFRCIWDKEEDAVAFRCAPWPKLGTRRCPLMHPGRSRGTA